MGWNYRASNQWFICDVEFKDVGVVHHDFITAVKLPFLYEDEPYQEGILLTWINFDPSVHK